VKICQPGEQAEQDATGGVWAVYNRLLALIRASAVDASASSRMAVLATSLYWAGVVIVAAVGQTIMITLGLSAG
jgi:hypothetical protein